MFLINGLVVGWVFSLTQGLDNIVGDTGNNAINSYVDGGVSTLSIIDTINGGDGTDTLTVLGGDLDNITEANVTNIEKLIFQSTAAGTVEIDDMTTVTDITTMNATVAGTETYSDMRANMALTVAGQAAGVTTEFDFAGTALSGSADAQTLTLNSAAGTINFTGTSATNGLETLNVVTTGGASTLAAFGAITGLKTVNYSGDQNVNLTTAFANTVTTVNASTATGKVTASVTAGGKLTFTGGTKDDTLDMAGGLDTDDTINGGDGNDTVTVSAPVTTTGWAHVTNVEILGMDITGTDDQDMDIVTGVNTVAVKSVNAVSDDLVITDAANNFTLKLDGAALLAKDTGTGANEDIDDVTVNLKTNTAGDALNVYLGSTTTGDANIDGFKPSINYETVTVYSQGNAENTIQSIDTALDNLFLSGATALEITTTNLLTGVLDGGAMTGALTTTSSTTALTVTGGSAADELTSGVVGAAAAQVFNGGAGNDTLTAGAIAAAATAAQQQLTLNGDAGNDTLTGAASTANAAVTLTYNGGAGIDHITLAGGAASVDTVVSTVTAEADADIVIGFVTNKDILDYNGSVANGTATTISTVEIADGAGTLTADVTSALTGNASKTAFIFNNTVSGDADTALTALANSTASTLLSNYATFETALIAELGTITSLDSTLSTTDAVLFAFVNGADTVVLRVTNTSTTVANTLTAAEIELVGVFDAQVMTNTVDIA